MLEMQPVILIMFSRSLNVFLCKVNSSIPRVILNAKYWENVPGLPKVRLDKLHCISSTNQQPFEVRLIESQTTEGQSKHSHVGSSPCRDHQGV